MTSCPPARSRHTTSWCLAPSLCRQRMRLHRSCSRSSGTIQRRQTWSGRLKRGTTSIEEFPMARMTGGQAVVEMLRRHGINTLFALPGVQNDALFGALYDAHVAIRVIHTRHEQGAAYM